MESPAERPDQRWAMDFVFDWCANRRQLKIFTLVDHFTRETLALESGHSLPARRVVEMLERLRMSGRCPQELRVDNGPEFVSKTLLRWCRRHHVNLSRALKLAQRKTYKTRHSEVSFASISEVQTAGRGRGQARAKRARRVGLTPVASCRIDGGRDGGRLHPMPLCKFPRRGSVQRTVRAL